MAKDGLGNILTDKRLESDIRDARCALDTLAGWLRSRYGGAQVVGVGHRVVHGGSQFTGPTVITPAIVTALRHLVPLAPLHQPYNLAAIEAVSDALARRAASRLFRYQFSSRPAAGSRSGATAA